MMGSTDETPTEVNMDVLARELAGAVNRWSAEGGSNTPDFVLGDFLRDALWIVVETLAARDAWCAGELREDMARLSSLDQGLAATLTRLLDVDKAHTPDFVLGGFLGDLLAAFDTAVNARDRFYGAGMAPGNPFPQPSALASVHVMTVHEPAMFPCSKLLLFSDQAAAEAAARGWVAGRAAAGAAVGEHMSEDENPWMCLLYMCGLPGEVGECVVQVWELQVDSWLKSAPLKSAPLKSAGSLSAGSLSAGS